MTNFSVRCSEALVACGCGPDAPALTRLLAIHFDALLEWNATHNLTRVTDVEEAVWKHIVDCVQPLLWLRDQRARWWVDAVDVGSGAGFPGVVMAAMMVAGVVPRIPLVLVEPAKKRQSFLRVVLRDMGLGDVRVMDPGSAVTGSMVLSRATFSPGGRDQLLPYVAPGGGIVVFGGEAGSPRGPTWPEEVRTWAVKGRTWRAEVVALPAVGASDGRGRRHLFLAD
jgi:16S rRNA G527 N7-methylase RsmG